MQLENVDDNGSLLRIKLGDKHKNLWGSVHGGVVASLVDAACGLSVIPFLKDGETMVTVVMQVQYFAPAHIGSGDLIGRGKVVNCGRHLISAEAEIFNEEEKLVAKGVSILKILRNHTLE
jgi:acyl-CoA thioesterase